ncbi:hypothetical protein FOCG_06506 [Fusarium oxysporum f. sp. radicis-lycopersici 26381]|uniref:Uncharacterized protein n=1 Tax=Fusarium oxysporum Fo47 TaxID=660027 RepID=W9L0F5_FUSOX|nr:hypothetical protein FOZG_03566 [Fusarium oxysporum Fo47]EWZ92814.1 hypothetical protein FOWG_05806 [Fusarium oxysporum f. sp. lycopersici MN25]EXL53094.1 hypothetical protein FOCG_06506 [Fusarium oxysporum f. sp. radicis-lycopersici 26381]
MKPVHARAWWHMNDRHMLRNKYYSSNEKTWCRFGSGRR